MGLKIDDNTTFGELAELWYNVYKKPRLKSPNSRAEVLNILNNHILPYLTSYLPSEITPAHVQIVLNPLEETSKTLYRKTLQTLRSIFTIAIDSNLILKSPLSDRVKAGGKATEEKKPLTTEQARRLLDAVRGTNVQTFIVIGLNAGLRFIKAKREPHTGAAPKIFFKNFKKKLDVYPLWVYYIYRSREQPLKPRRRKRK